MDRGTWWATVPRVTKSQIQLKQLSMHSCNFQSRTHTVLWMLVVELRGLKNAKQKQQTKQPTKKIPWPSFLDLESLSHAHVHTHLSLNSSRHLASNFIENRALAKQECLPLSFPLTPTNPACPHPLLILTTLNFLFPWINHFLIVPSDSLLPLALPHTLLVNLKHFSVLFLKCRYK